MKAPSIAVDEENSDTQKCNDKKVSWRNILYRWLAVMLVHGSAGGEEEDE